MKETISKKQLRDFGLLIGFGFPILIGWLLPALAALYYGLAGSLDRYLIRAFMGAFGLCFTALF